MLQMIVAGIENFLRDIPVTAVETEDKIWEGFIYLGGKVWSVSHQGY
jgi:hypothetical protein